ncbi:outer membrane protein assembly factor BamA [Rhodophyticola sp. CCM32]|uniref:outer membrane protein assembly factor BamA n=1 Tax=Rhodophyticola sp. CCM32 TaxID=2916397 RepID=UPI00107F7D38|nr:outer membrane protein assembly factor BamA [Rhodophyticola sp. CCM32]QBY02668.1 outer membrane protein assembly factor BamA [Rhodophyticola sp. CCM32]
MSNRTILTLGWQGRWRGLFAPLAALCLTCLLAWPVTAQDFRFSQFDVQGNLRIEASTILTYANIAPGEAVTAGQVNDAQQNLQSSGLFESVEVVPRGSTLVIIVQEYPTINRINIEGNRRLDDEDLLLIMTSQPRRVYSPSVAEQDAAAITDAYREAGRLTATVNPQIIRRSDNRVDLVFEVTEGRVVETERIAFVGNRNFSDRRLRRVLESTQAGLLRAIIRRDSFVADRIPFDQQLLTDFYRDRGYVDFEVQSVTSELARGRDAYFITFNIREGQSYDIGQITVVSDLPEIDVDEYFEAIRIRPGLTYSPRLIDNTIDRMENLATRQGLRFVRVEPRITRNDADLTLDVEFAVIRGDRIFVERIDIEGNATTLDRVVRRQFDTVEGDPFDPRAIRQASERIRALGYFSDVQVEGRQGTASDQVIVDVDLEEQPTGSLGFSVSYSSDTGTGLAISFAEQNFLGRGQSVGLSFSTASDSRGFDLSFEEPAFLRRDLSLGLDLFYNETNQENASFNTENIGFGTTLGFPISEYGRMAVFYRLSNDKILDVPSDSSAILMREEGSRTTSLLGYTLSYDTRNTGLNPNAGVFLRFSQEVAGLGGDNEYIRTTALASGETAIANEEVTLRATIEGGGLYMFNGNSRFTDRFFLSSRQMRGFEPRGLGPRDLASGNDDALGGNFFAVARFEAAFPLGLPDEYGISGGLFADIGTVWGLDDTSGTGGVQVDDSLHFRSSVGFSIFWDTAIGPLRFNFSHAIDTLPYDRTRDFDLTIEARF